MLRRREAEYVGDETRLRRTAASIQPLTALPGSARTAFLLPTIFSATVVLVVRSLAERQLRAPCPSALDFGGRRLLLNGPLA